MTVFKSVDTRGLSFFSAMDQMTHAYEDVKADGILEVILDKKKSFAEAFKKLVETKGYRVSNTDEDNHLIRLFIQKVKGIKKK